LNIGEKQAEYARSPKSFKGKLLVARVRTVKSNEKQKRHAEEEWYSVIDELIDLG